jgi:hypothetical protein
MNRPRGDCPVAGTATILHEFSSGYGDSYTTSCPLCTPNGYRLGEIVGVWNTTCWVYDEQLLARLRSLHGSESADFSSLEFATDTHVRTLFVAAVVSAASRAFPATASGNTDDAVLSYVMLPHAYASDRETALQRWRDRLCGVTLFPAITQEPSPKGTPGHP